MKQKRVYFPALDYFKFAGCLLIFIYHYDGLCGFNLPINKSPFCDFIIKNGNEAILLFFMVSGFCMAAGYRDNIRIGEESFGAYAVQHYLKFLSMILLTLPITVIKAIFMYKAGLDTMPNLYGFLLDILNIRTGYNIHPYFGYNGPLWFINVLFLIYILFFGVCRICKDDALYRTACIGIVFLSISQMANDGFVWFILNRYTFNGLSGFFMGCIVYEIADAVRGRRRLQRRISILCMSIITVIVTAIYFNVHFPGIGTLPQESNLFMNYEIVLLLGFFPEIIFLASEICMNRWMKSIGRMLGKLATSIYIWHWPIIYIQYALMLLGKISLSIGSSHGLAISFSITFTIAILSFTYFEKKVLRRIYQFWEVV